MNFILENFTAGGQHGAHHFVNRIPDEAPRSPINTDPNMLRSCSIALVVLVVAPASALAMGGMVNIKYDKSWAAPGGGSQKCQIHAKVAGRTKEIGSCGVEVIDISGDGLVNGDDCRKRGVLSGTLFVAPEFRRQGVAQRLLMEAEGKARWMGVDEMLLLVQKGNKAALNLYSKLGYEAMPRTSDHGNQVCLKKHLYLNPHSLRSMAPQVTWVKAL
jgi:GNAT superfamily N-acetyltransferase